MGSENWPSTVCINRKCFYIIKGWERQVWNCFSGLRYLLQHNVLMYAVRFSEGSCFAMQTCFSSLFLFLHKDPLCLSSILLTDWLKGGALSAKEGEEHERKMKKQSTELLYKEFSSCSPALDLQPHLQYNNITTVSHAHICKHTYWHVQQFLWDII